MSRRKQSAVVREVPVGKPLMEVFESKLPALSRDVGEWFKVAYRAGNLFGLACVRAYDSDDAWGLVRGQNPDAELVSVGLDSEWLSLIASEG
jgi:hypothetical protein